MVAGIGKVNKKRLNTENTYLAKHLFAPIQIMDEVATDLEMVIVIPCYNEPDILGVLSNLMACKPIEGSIEIIVVINSSEREEDDVLHFNANTFWEIEQWKKDNLKEGFKVFVLNFQGLPHKVAGVGLARKLGMDEAVKRLEDAGNPNGIIVNLDADCRVRDDYLIAVSTHFIHYPKSNAASIYFEHPLNGDLSNAEYEAVKKYELYMRYYVQGLRYAGYPYAYQTVGSSMVVRSLAYQQMGGMNKRKAGEDFYFLQKLMLAGNFSEINNTVVYPSPRISGRVPFGTGKSVDEIIKNKNRDYLVNHTKCFHELKTLMESLEMFYRSEGINGYNKLMIELTQPIVAFLTDERFFEKLNEIKANSSNFTNFKKRFFYWLNGLKVLQFIHYCRDYYFGETEVEKAAATLLEIKYGIQVENYHSRFLLEKYRLVEHGGHHEGPAMRKVV
jgi:cellulose synthase/poly-beta-1,6-N-acetylglucosamine synthase-like glycosyltransferase